MKSGLGVAEILAVALPILMLGGFMAFWIAFAIRSNRRIKVSVDRQQEAMDLMRRQIQLQEETLAEISKLRKSLTGGTGPDPRA